MGSLNRSSESVREDVEINFLSFSSALVLVQIQTKKLLLETKDEHWIPTAIHSTGGAANHGQQDVGKVSRGGQDYWLCLLYWKCFGKGITINFGHGHHGHHGSGKRRR